MSGPLDAHGHADVEPVPAAARDVFGHRLVSAQRLAQHLATSAVERGLIGPRERDRLWTRHILNCAVLEEVVPQSSRVLDVGSGAGLPGLPLAIARPDVHVTLVEPLERRVDWLMEVIQDLGLDVGVVRARAEQLHGEMSADVVTARAVAPLDRLAGWGMPLVSPGGTLLAIKGRSAGEELGKSAEVLRRLGARSWDVLQCGEEVLDVPTTVVRVVVETQPRREAAASARRVDRRASRRGRGGARTESREQR